MDWKGTPYPVRVTFDKYMSLVETGDVLVFSGKGTFSKVIKAARIEIN